MCAQRWDRKPPSDPPFRGGMQVLQGMTEEQRAGLTPIKLRRKARDFAMKAVKSQRDHFKRCATACRTENTHAASAVTLVADSVECRSKRS